MASIDDFIAKNQEAEPQRDLLEAYSRFLSENGRFVEKGDLKKHFTEVSTVGDKNGVPIEIAKCVVCGSQEYEVKEEG